MLAIQGMQEMLVQVATLEQMVVGRQEDRELPILAPLVTRLDLKVVRPHREVGFQGHPETQEVLVMWAGVEILEPPPRFFVKHIAGAQEEQVVPQGMVGQRAMGAPGAILVVLALQEVKVAYIWITHK